MWFRPQLYHINWSLYHNDVVCVQQQYSSRIMYHSAKVTQNCFDGYSRYFWWIVWLPHSPNMSSIKHLLCVVKTIIHTENPALSSYQDSMAEHLFRELLNTIVESIPHQFASLEVFLHDSRHLAHGLCKYKTKLDFMNIDFSFQFSKKYYKQQKICQSNRWRIKLEIYKSEENSIYCMNTSHSI